ncbi:MAG: hypothetical protein FJ398_26410 [Verrucomicrobia bacterium]|nr:hypothetical protein [Verrucomicrobiota bacterium]
MSNCNPHAHIDAINLALDQATAAKIRERPELIEVGKANLRRWTEQDAGFIHPVHAEWLDSFDAAVKRIETFSDLHLRTVLLARLRISSEQMP